MSLSEFERLLAAAMPARGRLAITLTELPTEDELYELLDRAIVAGDASGAPLVEIHAPRVRYGLEDAWRHAQVKDSAGVVRLLFEAAGEAPAMAA